MLRFSKRSRITFSTPPGGVPIDRDRQPRLWADRPHSAASDIDVLDVDDEAVLVDEVDDGESDGRGASGKFELPPPRLPPRKSSALHTLPPTSLKPQPLPAPVPAPALPALPAPKAPPKKLASSVAPVAIEVDVPKARKRPQPRSTGRSVGRPNFVWGAALLVVGAAAGFSVSIFTPQGVAMRDMAKVAAGESVEAKATAANAPATDVAPSSPAAVAPTTLTFNDTPLDIHVPAAISAPAASATAPAAAQAAPIALTSKASEKPSGGGGAARVAPAQAAKPPALPTKLVEAPARVAAAKAPETPAAPVSNPVPPAAVPAPHRNLAPAAVDALVSEQLRSALR